MEGKGEGRPGALKSTALTLNAGFTFLVDLVSGESTDEVKMSTDVFSDV